MYVVVSSPPIPRATSSSPAIIGVWPISAGISSLHRVIGQGGHDQVLLEEQVLLAIDPHVDHSGGFVDDQVPHDHVLDIGAYCSHARERGLVECVAWQDDP